MITVSIAINGHAIFTRSAICTAINSKGNTYLLDDGTTLKHRYEAGAVPLAIAMLNTIKDPKHTKDNTND